MNILHLAVVMFLCCHLLSESKQLCPRGHRLQVSTNGLSTCVQCESGANFMPADGHTNSQCYNCTKIEHADVEILASRCNTTHDAEIWCLPGYYRFKAREDGERDTCEKCTECQNTVRACGGYHDTMCCPAGHVAVAITNDVTICQKKPTLCGAGQYVSSTTSTIGHGCLPCPNGSYIYESNHTRTSCSVCVALTGDPTLHSAIVQDCNTTSPTVFGCQGGYFRSVLHQPATTEVKCSPCRKCQREVRPCDMYHDAICYGDGQAKLSMDALVKSTPGDVAKKYSPPPATQAIDKCPSGHYLHTNTSNGSSRCLPCDHLQLDDNSQRSIQNQTVTDQQTECHSALQTYQVYSIVLFTLAVLIDILYIYLYSRNFLKKTANFPRRNSTTKAEKISHVFGTVAIDIHFVFVFVHVFGIMCETKVIAMDAGILWTFTIAAGAMTSCVYFADTIVFLYVKQIVSLPACFRKRHNSRAISLADYDDGYADEMAIIDSTVM